MRAVYLTWPNWLFLAFFPFNEVNNFRTPDMPPRIAFNTVVFVEGVRT